MLRLIGSSDWRILECRNPAARNLERSIFSFGFVSEMGVGYLKSGKLKILYQLPYVTKLANLLGFFDGSGKLPRLTFSSGATKSALIASGWLTLTSSCAIRTKWPTRDNKD